MKKLRFIIALLSMGIIAGCSKDQGTHEQYEDDHRFFIKGKAAGLPFEYYAGSSDYYLETSYNFLDSVVEMVGILAPHGNVKRNAFEIRLRGQKSLPDVSQFEIEQNLAIGHIALRDATGFRTETDKFILTLSCDSSGTWYQDEPLWSFEDGTKARGFQIVKEVSLQDYQSFAARMLTQGSFSCEAEVEHVINLEDECDATFTMETSFNLDVLVKVENVVGAVDHVKWFHNDVEVNPTQALPPASPGTKSIYLGNTGEPHIIRCEVNFTDGCTKIIERKLGANFNDDCVTDFTVNKQREVIYDPMQLATVEITYYDDSGKAYTSHYNDVHGEFEIVSLTPFAHNQDGEATHRFFFQSEAVLKSSDGSTLELRDTYGSFAIAHP